MQCSICRLRLDAECQADPGTNLPRKKKKAAARPSTTKRRPSTPRRYPEADTSLWTEALFGAEILILHATPVYYGLGVPRGDGSAVVIIPGFLGTDLYLTELHAWLGRIGYRPYFSGIGINAECPNLLIQRRLNQTIDKALAETGRKIHLIGHSLGGVIARSLAGQRPKDVASVTHARRAHPRHGRESSCSPRCGSSSPPDSRRARPRSTARLLYRTMHLQFPGLAPAQGSRIDGRDRDLYAP